MSEIMSLKQLYLKIKTFIEVETENEMDDLRNMFYDIIQERKNEIEDKVFNNIIDNNDNSCISNMNVSDLKVYFNIINLGYNLFKIIKHFVTQKRSL